MKKMKLKKFLKLYLIFAKISQKDFLLNTLKKNVSVQIYSQEQTELKKDMKNI